MPLKMSKRQAISRKPEKESPAESWTKRITDAEMFIVRDTRLPCVPVSGTRALSRVLRDYRPLRVGDKIWVPSEHARGDKYTFRTVEIVDETRVSWLTGAKRGTGMDYKIRRFPKVRGVATKRARAKGLDAFEYFTDNTEIDDYQYLRFVRSHLSRLRKHFR